MTKNTLFTFNSLFICSMRRAQLNPRGMHGILETIALCSTKPDSVIQSMCHTLTTNMATLLYDS